MRLIRPITKRAIRKNYIALNCILRSSRPEVFSSKRIRKIHMTTPVPDQACNFIKKRDSGTGVFLKKEALAQVFSVEFCEISKKTFFHRIPLDNCFCISLKNI